MKPSEVAELLQVAPVTVRSWSTEFGQYFSATGRAGGGKHRDFTQTDVRMMNYIHQQRRAGRSSEMIAASLAQMRDADELDDLPMPNERITADLPIVPAAALDESRRWMLREIAQREAEIERLRAQVEQERERTDAERAKHEPLYREIGDLRAALAKAEERLERTKIETELELYKSGRLKPDA